MLRRELTSKQGTQADFDTNGVVDSEDYSIWVLNF